MKIKLVISLEQDEVALVAELAETMKRAGLNVSQGPRKRGEPVSDIVVMLGSTGAFTVLYKIMFKFLEKDKDRKIVLKYKDGEIEIVGHSMPEELELIQKFKPYLSEKEEPV